MQIGYRLPPNSPPCGLVFNLRLPLRGAAANVFHCCPRFTLSGTSLLSILCYLNSLSCRIFFSFLNILLTSDITVEYLYLFFTVAGLLTFLPYIYIHNSPSASIHRFAVIPRSPHLRLYNLHVELNEGCVPSEPAKDGSVSGLPARATGNNETTSGIPAGDAEKGGATDTLNTPRVSGESATEHRARVISVSDVGGDSSASPSLHA